MKTPWSLQASLVVIVTVVLDQVTKWWAVERLAPDVIEVLPTLEFDLTYNRGMSFSTGSEFGELIGIGVILVCGFLIFKISREQHRVRALLMATVLGGAVGNLLDRLFRGEGGLSGPVVDFIDVSWWAVFNVADIFVVCGVIAFGLFEFFAAEDPEHEATETVESAEPAS